MAALAAAAAAELLVAAAACGREVDLALAAASLSACSDDQDNVEAFDPCEQAESLRELLALPPPPRDPLGLRLGGSSSDAGGNMVW